MNGNVEGDKKGAYTYVSSIKKTLMDYILVNKEAEEEIVKIGETTVSNHIPLKVGLEMMKQNTTVEDGRRKTIYKLE